MPSGAPKHLRQIHQQQQNEEQKQPHQHGWAQQRARHASAAVTYAFKRSSSKATPPPPQPINSLPNCTNCSTLVLRFIQLTARHSVCTRRPVFNIVTLRFDRSETIIISVVWPDPIKHYSILYCGDYSTESDPPHKIMHYWLYYLI